MPRHVNRRQDLLHAALSAFVDRGYASTSVADLAAATGLSKAAFVYHFSSKEDLLFELAGPLLDDLDAVVGRHENGKLDEAALESLITDYLSTLCDHRTTAEWIDADKSILNHGDLGTRLAENNRRVHRLLAGGRPSKSARARASAILGMLWRPVRNGHLGDDPSSRRAIVDLAVSAAASLRFAR